MKINQNNGFNHLIYWYAQFFECNNCKKQGNWDEFQEIPKGITFKYYSNNYICENCGVKGSLKQYEPKTWMDEVSEKEKYGCHHDSGGRTRADGAYMF